MRRPSNVLTELFSGPNEAIVTKLARSAQSMLDSIWAIGESGAAGPSLHAKYRSEISLGYCPIAVVGPDGLVRTKVIRTGLDDRGQNMVAFAVASLQLLRTSLLERKTGPAKS